MIAHLSAQNYLGKAHLYGTMDTLGTLVKDHFQGVLAGILEEIARDHGLDAGALKAKYVVRTDACHPDVTTEAAKTTKAKPSKPPAKPKKTVEAVVEDADANADASADATADASVDKDKKKRGRRKKSKDEFLETEEHEFEGVTYLVDAQNLVYTYNIEAPVFVGHRLADGTIKLLKDVVDGVLVPSPPKQVMAC